MFETGSKAGKQVLMVVGLAVLLALGADPLQAAEGSGDWRATYDVVMRWINFGILAGLIFHFGRRPLTELLTGQAERHAERIRRLETRRDEARERLAEAQRFQLEHQGRLEVVRERIFNKGERQREALIEDGRREGEMLIDQARRRIGLALREAGRRLRDEMVDLAVDQALEKLPTLVTPQDDETRVAHFFKAVRRVP